VFDFSKGVSEHLLPQTTAYHEIWLDKKLVAGEALKDFEPLYGEFYLPRKVNNNYPSCSSCSIIDSVSLVQNRCRGTTDERRRCLRQ
jgi:Nitrite and sulphite reductase 4Fe-4S domain